MNNSALLITCFNRKEHTVRCLKKIYTIRQDFDIYLVDDNSTDGTSESISNNFPNVTIIQGNGNLFWNRGMHLAWQKAAEKDYDYYLWLNDDVVIYEKCFEELFSCVNLKEHRAIISGIIETNEGDAVIYGGTDENKKLINPNGKLNPITNMNGNIVLIPKYVFNILGNLDPVYHHDLGDVDYGLRARENNIGVYSTRIAVGSGQRDSFCRVRQINTSLKKRFQKLYSPLGAHPFILFYYHKKHKGLLSAISFFLFLHFLNIIPDQINHFLFGNKYT
ncbi:glycosyltransferase family 2 protein [Algibacter mikhailovii]|uniref:glycosyltransferase family 2 protein n=1 Tax=Algibacter mikhailovii TaxID=425498 RepID=UPI0024948AAC|nr:glycosyltransferase family 2 protein [Algibacter mikhailovii]